MSERKPADPAHAQDMHEDEDERPLAQRDHTVVSGDGDDQPRVQPAPRKEPAEERRYNKNATVQKKDANGTKSKTAFGTKTSNGEKYTGDLKW